MPQLMRGVPNRNVQVQQLRIAMWITCILIHSIEPVQNLFDLLMNATVGLRMIGNEIHSIYYDQNYNVTKYTNTSPVGVSKQS